MKDNKRLLEKFDTMHKNFNLISVPTISLYPEEADQFLDCIIDESAMKNYARVVKMTLQQKTIRHIGFGDGDFLYNGDEFNESKYKKQWTQNRITLTSKKIRGCVAVYDDDLEDVRGVTSEAAFVNQLMSIVTKKIANDLEYAFWIGDTNQLHYPWTSDSINGLWDGWRYILTHSQNATGTLSEYYNDVCGGADIKEACEGGSGYDFDLAGMIAEQDTQAPYAWEFKYHQMIKNMPAKYKANSGLAGMVFINSDLVTMDYLEALSQRATIIGDGIFQGKILNSYMNVPIVNASLMPVALGPDADGTNGLVDGGAWTDVLLIPKNNLIIGLQRDIKIESKREPADEATYYFYTMRVDVAVENVNAAVLLTCLTHAC